MRADPIVIQIDVAVNAPKAGTITELLAAEEDTVAVGQDLFRMEPGEAPAGGQQDLEVGIKINGNRFTGNPSAESAKSEPQAEKEAVTPVEKKEAVKATEETKKVEVEAPKKAATPAPAAPKKAAKPAAVEVAKPVVAGSRGETRVRTIRFNQD